MEVVHISENMDVIKLCEAQIDGESFILAVPPSNMLGDLQHYISSDITIFEQWQNFTSDLHGSGFIGYLEDDAHPFGFWILNSKTNIQVAYPFSANTVFSRVYILPMLIPKTSFGYDINAYRNVATGTKFEGGSFWTGELSWYLQNEKILDMDEVHQVFLGNTDKTIPLKWFVFDGFLFGGFVVKFMGDFQRMLLQFGDSHFSSDF